MSNDASNLPPAQRERLNRVKDPKLRAQLIALWPSTVEYERRLAAGDRRAVAFEQRIAQRKLDEAAAQARHQYESAQAGELGPIAKELAEQCASQLVVGASVAALHREFAAEWRAERDGRRRPVQQEMEASEKR